MMKEEEPVMFSAPRRLLLGVAFLFWGAMHDQPLPALIAAIVMEGRHWTNLRWTFGEKGFARSWQLSVLILILSTVGLFQIEERAASDFLNLLTWLPFMMLPLALAQQYASDPGVPMTTFSFIARRKMQADRRAGRQVTLRFVQLGYPYFLLILIVAGMGVGIIVSLGANEVRYAVGVALLVGWALFQIGGRRERGWAWGMAYVASILMAVGMSWGVIEAYQLFVKNLTRTSDHAGAAFETQTSIGQVQKLQLSPKIMWRYYHEEGERPKLLKISSYNWPESNLWRARMRRRTHQERIPIEREVGGDFEKMLEDGENAFIYHEKDRGFRDYAREGAIVGLVSEQSLIPHAPNAKRFEEVPTEILSVNSMGAVQINGPRQGAMEVRFYSDERLASIEHDPAMMDLKVPSREEKGLDRFLAGVGLTSRRMFKEGIAKVVREAVPEVFRSEGREVGFEGAPAKVTGELFKEVRERIRTSFSKDFKYTLFLTGADLQTPFSEFLNEKKEGHCEYFAGSAAMLFRRMGIPCRYVVGFAVSEKGKGNEWLLRGQHAHAWVQAYVGGTWVNEAAMPDQDPVWRCRGGKWVEVDLTPPDWASGVTKRSWMQGVSDWFQKTKADLVLWFAKPTVAGGFKFFLFGSVGSLLCYLVLVLVITRGREGHGLPGSWEESVRKQGLLRDFERWLSRRVGSRPSSMPLGSWLRKHLPEGGRVLAKSYEVATFRPEVPGAGVLKKEIRLAKSSWKEQQKTPGR